MNGLQFKMDFEEFCSAAISIPQFERWEWQVDNAYEIFEDEGNRVVMIEDLPKVTSTSYMNQLLDNKLVKSYTDIVK